MKCRNKKETMTSYTNNTNHTLSDDDQSRNFYGVKCYSEDTTHPTQLNTVCLFEIDGYNGCFAEKNEMMCRSCVYFSYGLCYGGSSLNDSNGGFYSGDGGYKVDCGNVDYRYSNARVCGDRLSAYYSTVRHSSSGSYHRSSSNGDDGIHAFLSVFKFAIILIFVLAGLLRRRLRRNITPNGRAVPTETTRLIPVADVAVAKETLLDTHDKFEFFSAQDVVAEKLKASVQSGDWESVRDTLQSMKQVEYRKNNNERNFYFSLVVDQISESWPLERTQDKESCSLLLDAWIATEPNSVDCRILRAYTGTAWAWHARSGRLAMLVAKRQRELFFSRLDAATIDLKLARELCPEDPLIYAAGITIAKGLQGKNKDAMPVEHCLDCLKGIASEPLLYQAHVAALQFYCRKWHGSHEKMFEYARAVTSELPYGHHLWVLIPMAHFERNLINGQREYWTRRDVVEELVQCYKKAFPAETETTSTSNTPFEKSLEWTCRNYYAYALARSRQFESARRQIRMIGRRPTKHFPWVTISNYKTVINALGFDVTEGKSASGDPIVAAIVV